MNNPLVSIIIPCYNAAPFVAETLESVIAQTYTHWECIIVDDHSTDGSWEIIESYQQRIPEKIFIHKNPRKGACAARNTGIDYAKGDYIQFLDADDLISNNKIHEQLQLLVKPENKHSITYCTTIYFFSNNESESIEEKNIPNENGDPTEFLINLWGGYNGKTSIVQTNAWLVPKEIIAKTGYWNENLIIDQDGEYFARTIDNSSKVLYTPLAINYYRKFLNKKTISTNNSREALKSALISLKTKKRILLTRSNSAEASVAIYKLSLTILMQSYLKYKDVYSECLIELPSIDYPYKITTGGNKFIKLISEKVNWKFAIILQHLVHFIKFKTNKLQ